MTTRILLVDAAVDDLLSLDRSVQARVLKKLLLLETNVEAGQPLGKRSKGNLTNLRKLVVGNRDWRIIYRVDGQDAEVWAIGGRDDDACYVEAASRLEKLGDHPQRSLLQDVLSLLKPMRRQKT